MTLAETYILMEYFADVDAWTAGGQDNDPGKPPPVEKPPPATSDSIRARAIQEKRGALQVDPELVQEHFRKTEVPVR